MSTEQSTTTLPDSLISAEIEQLRHTLTLWYIKNPGQTAAISADLNSCQTDHEQLAHLREWIKDVPTWFRIKTLCDQMPDSPRSRYERNGVRIARQAAQIGAQR
jgi:hypothetical protein